MELGSGLNFGAWLIDMRARRMRGTLCADVLHRKWFSAHSSSGCSVVRAAACKSFRATRPTCGFNVVVVELKARAAQIGITPGRAWQLRRGNFSRRAAHRVARDFH